MVSRRKTVKKVGGDPRCAQLEASLLELPAEKELAYRIALRGMNEYVQGDRAWNERVAILTKGFTEDQMADAMRQAREIRESLLKYMAEQVAT